MTPGAVASALEANKSSKLVFAVTALTTISTPLTSVCAVEFNLTTAPTNKPAVLPVDTTGLVALVVAVVATGLLTLGAAYEPLCPDGSYKVNPPPAAKVSPFITADPFP